MCACACLFVCLCVYVCVYIVCVWGGGCSGGSYGDDCCNRGNNPLMGSYVVCTFELIQAVYIV